MHKIKVYGDSRFEMPPMGHVLFRDLSFWAETGELRERTSDGKEEVVATWTDIGKLTQEVVHDYNGELVELSNYDSMLQYLVRNHVDYAVVS
jgi:hypothetical protein